MSAKTTAVKLLSRREHSTFEIRDKLLKREYGEEEVAQVIEELQQGGWLSDERFAEAYVRMRRNKGFGPVRIRMELGERGVSDAIIERYLQADDPQWLQVLDEQYRKKYRGRPAADYQDKARRVRFLQYRGFALEQVYALLESE